jgi:fructose-bisphosphate aldolase class I
VINSAIAKGIAAIVRQQVEVGQEVLASGLVPMLEPEINIKSPDRADSDQIMLNELITQLSAMPGTEKVMLKLSLPVKPGLFDPLVNHPRVLRVVALSGGYNRPDACAELAKNRGIVASFSRALLEDLRFQMSDDEFDASLASAIDDIYRGSTQKIATATA